MLSERVSTKCPKCQTSVRIEPQLIGDSVRCPACREKFVVTSVSFLESAAEAFATRMNSAESADTMGGAKPVILGSLPLPGGRLGRFALHEVLGRGSFGVVYRAHDPLLDRQLALKLPLFARTDRKRAQRFLNEAKAAAKLRHPNIVAVYESGEVDGKLYLAAEFVAGKTLSDTIQKSRPTFEQAAGWVRELANALAYAHSQGIVHRDIKPQNIMIDGHGRPQIMDFGLAKRLDQDSKLTSDGAVLGTPAYMAPEQARGETDNVGPASDQYSLGTVLYELLTGRRPFDGAPVVVLAAVASDEPPAPRSIDPTIPLDLEAICRKAMDKDPGRRYAEIALLTVDLDRWLRGDPVRARPLPRLARFQRWAGRRPLVASLTGIVALLLLTAMASGITSAARMHSSTNELQTRLEEVQKETELTRELAEEADAATAAARSQTEAADGELKKAQRAEESLEQALADRERTLEQKSREEERLAEAIEQRQQDEVIAKRAATERAANEKTADATQTTAMAARRRVYVDLLRQAQAQLNDGDRKTAGELLEKCSADERRWEWRFLKGQAQANATIDRQRILYTMFKEARNPVKTIIPGGLVHNPSVGFGATSNVPDSAVKWISDDGRTMPSTDDDPVWVNLPPSMTNAMRIPGQQIEAVSPTGLVIVTSELAKNNVPIQVVCIDSDGKLKPLRSSAAPMHRVAIAKQQKEKMAMGFAFSRDGTAIAQLSTVPADTKKSMIRTLPLVTGKETWGQPESEIVKGLTRAASASPGKIVNLAKYYNEHTADESSHLILESDMGISPDGSRIARFDKDLAIHVLDHATMEEIVAVPSGLVSPEQAMKAVEAVPWAFDPTFEIGLGRVLWSLDGKRLYVRIRTALAYTWGTETLLRYADSGAGYTDGNMRRVPKNDDGLVIKGHVVIQLLAGWPTSGTADGMRAALNPFAYFSKSELEKRMEAVNEALQSSEVVSTRQLRIPPIYFDCLIVLNAE